jgi:radical SAM superfamily enzyme YgiQ (UPF0313 family)
MLGVGMRVLLVYWNPSRELLPAPPIGLAYVAASIRDAGHLVHILDLFGHRHPLDALRTCVIALRPDVVGLSIRNIDTIVRQRPTWHLAEVARLATVVRDSSRARIVLGGPAVSILGADALRHVDADWAVVGEGEVAFPRLLAAIEHGEDPGAVAGVVGRAGRERAEREEPARLSAFGPSHMEDWIDWRRYERAGATWPIQTKRGCPLSCSYCAYPAIEGHTGRAREPGDVADEIARVQQRLRPRTFEFVDSTFNVPARHAEGVCEAIVRRGLRVRLTAMGVNPLGISPELFTLMRRAGFASMMITPESASDTILARLQKGFGVEAVHRAADLARRSGMRSLWFFMLGGPGETRETVEETVSFVEEHLAWPGCVSIFVTGVRVLPGTALARQACADGLLAPDRDLAEPTYYLSPDLDEEWILARINRALDRCPGIVHAAEEGTSVSERLMHLSLRALGVPPPHWRFLPTLLRLPLIPWLRRHHPPILLPPRP